MPAPSEAFKWLLWPDLPKSARVCGVCGVELTVKSVGEYRTTYEYRAGVGYASPPVFWCTDHRGGRG